MEKKEEYKTERIDHLGIVAGVCKRIRLIETIDETLPTKIDRKVSCGQATQAMVLNALGFSGRALYLMPEYMHNKPIDVLIGEGLKAEDFNDDTLGMALDDLQQAGVTEMFAGIVAEAIKEYGIEMEYVHLDSSTLTLHGKYESEYAKKMTKTYETAEIRRGYSKDHRPDLKQVVVNLITSQASALPLWLEVLDGNSNDTATFQKSVTAYCKQLEEGTPPPWFVMDSAGYSHDNLQAWQKMAWVTRIPETLSAAKTLLRSVATEAMTAVEGEADYRICPVGAWYGNVKQRWLLVYSSKAYQREKKQFEQRLDRREASVQTAWRTLSRRRFQCRADAEAAALIFSEQHPWWLVTSDVQPIIKHLRPGRPPKGAQPSIVGWRIRGHLARHDDAIAEHIQWFGRFILGTNILNEVRLSDSALLSCYKKQSSSVERGFRFLKDPLFFADSLFVKSPVRVTAMIMVMGLALLVYALAERELRLALVEHDAFLPHQTGRPTQAITMRRVAQIFEGVDLLIIHRDGVLLERRVLNLSPLRHKILNLFHPIIQNCYLLNSWCGT